MQSDGSVSPCCHFSRTGSVGNLHRQTPEEAWNSHEMKTLRLEMLEGAKEIPHCVECRRTENIGERSLRHEFFRIHAEELDRAKDTRADGGLETFNPVSLTISTGDRCQLRCKMCGPFNSSAWKKKLGIPADADSLRPDAQARIRAMVASASGLKQVLFHGGEPLISALHYDILDLLLEQGRQSRTELFYNSNLFQLRWTSKDVLDYWNRFPHVTVYASVDGTGERFEEIRQGHTWERMLRNLEEIRRRSPHVDLYCFFTLSIYNFLDVPDEMRRLLADRIFPIDRILFNFVRDPESNAQSAPLEQRQEAKRKYLAFMKELLLQYDAADAAHMLGLLRMAFKYLESDALPKVPGEYTVSGNAQGPC